VPGGEEIMNEILKLKNRLEKILFFSFILVISITRLAFAQGIATEELKKVLQIKGEKNGMLVHPSDVAVLAGKIYVVDGGHHRVVVFDIKGKLLFEFGEKGNDNGQMNYPVGIFVATNKRVYVADSGNHRIQIFSAGGDYLSSFKIESNNKPRRPIDVIRHSRTGNIFITSSNHDLLVYSPKGEFLHKWGGNGTNQGEFRYPATISELKDGRIAVVDVLNSRVQVFDVDGNVSMVVGEWGVLPGQLIRPKGVAIDTKGNFYISDSYMNLVQSFSEIGQFVSVLGKKGQPYKMVTPVGMTIDNNKLYIVEMRKHKVSVYQLAN